MEIFDLIKAKPYRYVFFTVFISYFLFYQIADRLLIFLNLASPPGIGLIVSNSPPVNPSQMPFPLWGPFLSLNTSSFTWAITPLSLTISLILSLLVSTNVVLYLFYYFMIRAGARRTIAGSLGLIATSLSCSCELFTALIGSATSSLPFLSSIAFMDTLSEGLVALAVFLLSLSSFVLYSEVSGKEIKLNFSMKARTALASGLVMLSLLLPTSVPFSLVKIIVLALAGGIESTLLSYRSKYLLLPSAFLMALIIAFYPYFYSSPALFPLSFMMGVMGNLGFQDMQRWAKLGIMHTLAWTMIMPGPISLIIGYPLPFFNFGAGDLIEMWIFSWIAGTPIAWFAGIYYLRYIRKNMSSLVTLRLINKGERKGLTWITLGVLALLTQIAFFVTHIEYFVDYNGFDYSFLTVMTLTSTSVMVGGSVALGYGIYQVIKSKFSMPKVKKKNLGIYSLVYAALVSVLGGLVHFGVSGFTYPTFYFFSFGIPMLDPSFIVYLPPLVGIYVNPIELLQVIGVSIMGGYMISLLKEYRSKGNVYALGLGALGVCPACFLSTYVFGFVSLSLGISALFSLSDELMVSLSSDALLLLALILTVRNRNCKLETTIKNNNNNL